MARSRYLLFKHHIKWTETQNKRAELLLERYPELKKAYFISLKVRNIFKLCKSKEQAFKSYSLDEFAKLTGKKEAEGGFSSGFTDGPACTMFLTQFNCTQGSCTADCSGSWGCFGTLNCP